MRSRVSDLEIIDRTFSTTETSVRLRESGVDVLHSDGRRASIHVIHGQHRPRTAFLYTLRSTEFWSGKMYAVAVAQTYFYGVNLSTMHERVREICVYSAEVSAPSARA